MKLATEQLDAEAQRLLGLPYRDLTPEQRRVLLQIARRGVIARNLAADGLAKASLGDGFRDALARFGGSWVLLAGVLGFLAAWILLNGLMFTRVGNPPFDPYPYVLLNLIVSILAAIQAPVIIMLLNRQARIDRERSGHDYEVNLKAELQILAVQEKIEALRDRELADILAHQVELLQELRDRPRSTAA